MGKIHNPFRSLLLSMAAVGTAGAVIVTVLRVLLTPGMRDAESGRLNTAWWSIGLIVAVLLALVLLARRAAGKRVDIHGRAVLSLAAVCLLAGAVLAVQGAWEIIRDLMYGTAEENMRIAAVLGMLERLFHTLSGGVLVAWGLQIASEGGTRVGMISWSGLVPTLWLWLRLAAYEMSYASAVSINDGFFDFAMFIAEVLFLFKLARFASGIGKTRPGTLMAYASATAMLALSAPLTRVCLYLLDDAESFAASGVSDVADFAVGVLALCFAWSLAVSSGTADALPEPPTAGGANQA